MGAKSRNPSGPCRPAAPPTPDRVPSQTVVVRNAIGLHARPAALFVKTTRQFPETTIRVARDGRDCDARSIIGILTVEVGQGTPITISTEGPDAEAALAAMVGIAEAGLGESMTATPERAAGVVALVPIR